MQADAQLREQLRTQLTATGIALDEARLDALLPVYQGLLNGARRLASLDLGDAEPATTFKGGGMRDEG